jgi:STE24 endopeptidase
MEGRGGCRTPFFAPTPGGDCSISRRFRYPDYTRCNPVVRRFAGNWEHVSNDEGRNMTDEPTDLDVQDPTVLDVDSTAAGDLSPEERAEAQRYGRISLRLTLVDMAVDVVFLAIMAFVFARPLDAWLAGFGALSGEKSLLRLLALFAVVIGIHILVSLPLSFYSGFVVEHQFKLSNQSLRRWVTSWLKKNTFGVVLGAAIYAGLYSMIWHTGTYWWLIAAGVFFLFSVILGQLAPVVFLPLFYKIERLNDAALMERMERLAAGTGLAIEGVYRMGLSADTVKANAMLAGLGRTRRVLMGDTLLEKFSPDEIEVIFAHEIGHHVHRHIPKMIVTGVVFSVAGFWLLDRVLVAWAGVPTAADVPTSSLPLVMFSMTIFGLMLAPLQNVISRHYERQCDRYALTRTGLRGAYRSAFQKLARLNKDDPEPNPVEVFLLHSHPPIAERLALAD